MDFSQTKISCAHLSTIMAVNKKVLSPIQKAEMETLLVKPLLTPPQQKKLADYIDRSDNPPLCGLSVGCVNLLKGIYSRKRYGTRYSIKTAPAVAQLRNGTKCEYPAIEMLRRLTGLPFHRDKKTLENEFITGQIDIMEAETIEFSDVIHEVKTHCNLKDFRDQIGIPLNAQQVLQIQGYLMLTDKDKGEMHYCLTPYPDDVIAEQKSIYFADNSNKPPLEIIKKWDAIERQLRYEDIPEKERVISYQIYRDETVIQSIKEKVEICREWLNRYAATHQKLIETRYYDSTNVDT